MDVTFEASTWVHAETPGDADEKHGTWTVKDAAWTPRVGDTLSQSTTGYSDPGWQECALLEWLVEIVAFDGALQSLTVTLGPPRYGNERITYSMWTEFLRRLGGVDPYAQSTLPTENVNAANDEGPHVALHRSKRLTGDTEIHGGAG